MTLSPPPPPRDDDDPLPDASQPLDQWLSDHLDDRLTGQSLIDLQNLMDRDSTARDAMAAMTSDRALLRQAFAAAAHRSVLPSDFAARTVALAERRAKEPAVAPTPITGSPSVRWIAAIVSVAAAIAIVAGLNLRGTTTTQDSFAKREQSQPADPSPTRDLPQVARVETKRTEAIGNGPIGNGPMGTAEPTRQPFAPPATEPTIAQSQDEPPSRVAVAAQPTDPLRIAEAKVEPTIAASGLVAAESLATLRGAVLVYDIELTMLGRASDAMRQAMRDAGIDPASEQSIDSQVVSAAAQATDVESNDGVRILYLRDSAKRLDRLFSLLMDDSEDVASLSISLVTDAPLLKLTNQLQKLDPTKVQQSTVSLELSGRSVGSIGERLRGQSFMPLPRNAAGGSSMGLSAGDEISQGSDVMSSVILLVR